jgi:hypothetical protein
LRRPSTNLFAAGLAGLLLLIPAIAVAAGESTEAEALIRQGVELRQQKKDERALPLFEKAYQLSRTPRTAGQLGLVQMAVGYFVDAERHLAEALASPDHPWVAKNLPTLKAQMEAVKSKIGELMVNGAPAGAEVVVNGKVVGKLPLPAPVRLDKGRAEIQVRAPGYVTAEDVVTITGGKREDRAFALTREAAPAPMPPPVATVTPPPSPAPMPGAPMMPPPSPTTAPTGPAAAAAPPSAEPSGTVTASVGEPSPGGGSALRPWAWGGAAGAVAFVALGAVEGLISRSKAAEFNDHTGPSPLDPTMMIKDCNTDALTAACRPLKEDHERAQALSIVGFAVGGALAAGSAVLFWLSSSSSSAEPSQSAFACLPDPAGRGVACSLRF